MEYVRRNNVCFKGNEVSFALMRFYVKITPVVTIDKSIVAWAEISKDPQNSIGLSFSNMEEALSFTQNEVNESKDFAEINEKYSKKYINGRQKTISHP